MDLRIDEQLAYINSRAHRALRRPLPQPLLDEIAADIQNPALSLAERVTRRLERFLALETPMLLPHTRVQILRTVPAFPDIHAPGEMDGIRKTHFVHEQGRLCNLACDYEIVLREGLEGRRARLPKEKTEYISCVHRVIDAALSFADRYADLEEASGLADQAEALRRTARYGARTFPEALQLFRLLHFVLWCSGSYHNTVGRFDQYMLPYYERSIASGEITEGDALALIEDFFLSFNRDSDLYFGVMQGDNGQSLVLGGCKADGSTAVNRLTYLAIEASLAIRQIDPKLNLRCDSTTPVDLYELGTRLTRAGMGFPQYANDDVIVPGLTRLGYDLEDARNYVTAACWEFIIPGKALDIPNIGALSLSEITRDTIGEGLYSCDTFDSLKALWRQNIINKAKEVNDSIKNLYYEPNPYLTVLMDGALEKGQDISQCAKYNNFGFHGTGFSSAVDQMAAVEKYVYDEEEIDKDRLLTALDNDFAEDSELYHLLRFDAPKLGRDESAKALAHELIQDYADALAPLRNERGGIVRGGTGSAMYYLWHSEHLGATADGRHAGEPLPANFSPALYLTEAGLFSVIDGFTPDDLALLPNGGPFTLELHDTIFAAPDSIEKVAAMVRTYIRLGGHQMQLNAVNRDALRDAQLHPENHGDLVVRVWGWSGRFVELEKSFQDQILSRTEYGV